VHRFSKVCEFLQIMAELPADQDLDNQNTQKGDNILLVKQITIVTNWYCR